MVKYRLVRPETEGYEKEEAKREQPHPRKRRMRGPISVYKDTAASYRSTKKAVSDYYQSMVDEQKAYYDHDDNWQIREQYQRNQEFTKKLLKYGLAAAVLIGLYWLFRIFFLKR
ncbi:hypothetical protein ACVRXQ_06580 [Streptococcus panodentis]|uniref:Uncharacterized protein n=1 Tax=Streptococcus panodentis TaxID=1581472 RepID=A0ABS5AW48_9STRE|nr:MULTISPECIES: hypothetical protein [Streptococcus]MBP2620478.1 hypothetical protein [Streptococcus panodentis]